MNSVRDGGAPSLKYDGRFFGAVVVLESSAGVARPRMDDGTRDETKDLETLRSGVAFKHLNLEAVDAILYCTRCQFVRGLWVLRRVKRL